MTVAYNFILGHVLTKKKECIIWPFGKTAGYGQLRIPNGPVVRAHHLMCRLKYGDPPKDKPNALHTCKNKPCINPNHLYWGNQMHNMLDAYKDGRVPHKKWR